MKFYNNNELKRVLTIIFEENGISIDDSDTIQTIDSLQYMSILLAIEEELNIEYNLIDYEYLNATVVTRNVGFWYNKDNWDR